MVSFGSIVSKPVEFKLRLLHSRRFDMDPILDAARYFDPDRVLRHHNSPGVQLTAAVDILCTHTSSPHQHMNRR